MKIELKREEKGIDIVNFYAVFEPETVEETLLLKELEQVIEDKPVSHNWDGIKFIVCLT